MVDSASGGGMHPGKTTIWPSGKGAKDVKGPTESQQTGGVKGGISTAKGTEAAKEAQVVKPSTPDTTAAGKPRATVVRALTVQDIANHLLLMQLQPSKLNIQLASVMMKYGLELSKENLQTLTKMLDGSKNTMNEQEAAVALLAKGVTDSPKAVQTLGQFLNQHPQMASQLLNLKGDIAKLIVSLNQNNNILNPTMIGQLGSILAQLDSNIAALTKRYLLSMDEKSPHISRQELMSDLRAISSMLKNIEDKTKGQPENKQLEQLKANLKNMQTKLEGIIKNLSSQAMLSQKSERSDMQQINYAYWQIPNLEMKPPKNIDILIERDPSSSKGAINPANTRIVLALEGDNLGKVSVDISIKGKDVGFLFNTENDKVKSYVAENSAALRKAVFDKNFKTVNFQAKVNAAMTVIKSYLIPQLDSEEMMRVDLEA